MMSLITAKEYKESEFYAETEKRRQQPAQYCVPIPEKVTLSIKEAAAYSGIGQNKLDYLLRSPRCPFVLYVGTKKLVKRKKFEKFISDNIEI